MEIKTRIELVKLLPEDSVAAEVGVAEGNFSRDLLAAGVKTLIMVDYWGHIPGVTGDGNFPQGWHDENMSKAFAAVSPFGPRAVVRKMKSTDAARTIPDGFLDLVYLDAGHYYSAVMEDLVAWWPKLKPGGIMAGHDYLNQDYGVRQAVADFTKNGEINVIPENNPSDASFYFYKSTITI